MDIDEEKDDDIKDDLDDGYRGTVCVVCGGRKKDGYLTCKDCYYEGMDFFAYLKKDCSSYEYRDHYFNLKDVIYRMDNYESVKRYCNKLIAIAIKNECTNDDSSLWERVINDIKDIIEYKRPKEEKHMFVFSFEDDKEEKQIESEDSFVTEIVDTQDEKILNNRMAIDGHMVKSRMEEVIDNVLWNAGILHAYEQPITEFVYERKKCDWFIPIIGTGKGIYIEYWGMETSKYIEVRKKKEALYEKYNVPYIGIEKDAPKDESSFRSVFFQELQRKAIEVYGFMPQWGNKNPLGTQAEK